MASRKRPRRQNMWAVGAVPGIDVLPVTRGDEIGQAWLEDERMSLVEDEGGEFGGSGVFVIRFGGW